MTMSQEEALYEFLDNAPQVFDLGEVVSFVRRSGSRRGLADEIQAFINQRNLAFEASPQRWVSRRGFFESLPFVISPTRLELLNGILLPGHRCVPFACAGLLPHEYSFVWQGTVVPFTTTEGPPDEFYPFYSLFGEEYAPQYVARDNRENEEAFNSDPYDDPPEVSVTTLDMRNIYRETSFVPGDRFVVRTLDWKTGRFELKKVGKDEWAAEELKTWLLAAEKGFEESFRKLGPSSCTEEQIAYAYWYGSSRMRELPAYSLEDFLYEKTDRIETVAYGIESRFWFAGREIPDWKELDTSGMRPDKTPVEEIFSKLKIPISEYVIQSYIRDSLYREDGEEDLIIDRLLPSSGPEIPDRDWNILAEYVENVLAEFRDIYSQFTDKVIGSVRQRAGELHTAVINLAARLCRGDVDSSWLPRHTFIILSQIQGQTAHMLEDLGSEEAPDGIELDAMDSSLDSMIETYEELKELIDEALDSFRRNKLAVVRAGSGSGAVAERLLQVSIGGGIDVWRRLIVPEACTCGELHHIIQTVFGWRDSQKFRFSTEAASAFPGKEPVLPDNTLYFSNVPSPENALPGGEIDLDISILDLENRDCRELLYEYGTKWTVRIMILSRYETPGSKPVRCVAGDGAAPPEFIGGPLRFKKVLATLENGNDMERLGARQELGPDFSPGDFDIDACNRSLGANYSTKRPGPDR